MLLFRVTQWMRGLRDDGMCQTCVRERVVVRKEESFFTVYRCMTNFRILVLSLIYTSFSFAAPFRHSVAGNRIAACYKQIHENDRISSQIVDHDSDDVLIVIKMIYRS